METLSLIWTVSMCVIILIVGVAWAVISGCFAVQSVLEMLDMLEDDPEETDQESLK